MSFLRGLDEHLERELESELLRRRVARMAGLCDYCGQSSSAPACRFPKRHALPQGQGPLVEVSVVRRWRAALEEVLLEDALDADERADRTRLVDELIEALTDHEARS